MYIVSQSAYVGKYTDSPANSIVYMVSCKIVVSIKKIAGPSAYQAAQTLGAYVLIGNSMHM
jgi:hypothetical protein